MQFVLTGKPLEVSREFVRAWLWASACVLSFHNKNETWGALKVELIPPTETRDFEWGLWIEDTRTMRLRDDMDAELMATTILHEMIHALCGYFGDNTNEKCTSTLTAKLKPDVAKLAQVLVDGTYRRAAYIAHTKLSYKVDHDHYDQSEDEPVGVKDPHHKSEPRTVTVDGLYRGS